MTTELEKTSAPARLGARDGISQPQGSPAAWAAITGTGDPAVVAAMIGDLDRALSHDDTRINSALALAECFKAADPAQGALAVQFALAHAVAVDMAAHALLQRGPAKIEAVRAMATASKASIAIAEAIHRAQRGPATTQIVRVERVEVSGENAQAIVGAVAGGSRKAGPR